MKMQYLALGARFEFEGEVFVKTGPLTAASEKGGQRLIPRHAVLRALDVPAAGDSERKGKRLVDRDKLLQAFDDFYAQCEGLVGEAGRADLVEARARFLKRVG